MGKPIHDPLEEFGDDCNACKPDPWPAGKTPRKMTLTFVGIDECLDGPPWVREIPPIQSVVEQDDGDPCLFVGDNVFYDIDGTDLYLTIGGVTFFYDDNAWCEPFGSSILDCEEADKYESGTFTAVWYDIPAQLMWTFGLYPRPFPLWDFIGLTDDGCQVHRFCHPYDKTNVKIKFDTNLAEICRP